MDVRIQTAVKYFHDHINSDILLCDVAENIGLSESRFSHLFKEETHITPAQYLKTMRIRRAQELLVTTRLSIKEIFFSVGFKDKTHFLREFKRVHGIPPVEYRTRYTRPMQPTRCEI